VNNLIVLLVMLLRVFLVMLLVMPLIVILVVLLRVFLVMLLMMPLRALPIALLEMLFLPILGLREILKLQGTIRRFLLIVDLLRIRKVYSIVWWWETNDM
jgi:hypothetical protein